VNKRIVQIRREDMDSLVDYTWPGNVRELQNVVERAVILTLDTVLHLFPFGKTHVRAETASASKTLEQVEREHILQTLHNTDWVIGGPYGAATKLGMRRTTLLYKMRRLGISRPEA
jgi:transcriptional regulator with GAF, ATPase, and Fis domain